MQIKSHDLMRSAKCQGCGTVVKDQWEMICREMDNVETGLSVKVIEEVDEPTGSLMLLEKRTDKKRWLVEN
ncbi:hypothetical protein ALC53_07101 [Atta colombica]|uniref:Uncharacterized protein n=1 Tax=Atta colombica TaxID=520822 RepID=A0A195BEM0_9HYME|nr:hypothetical protein ALC53_07101 [Atta colombica]